MLNNFQAGSVQTLPVTKGQIAVYKNATIKFILEWIPDYIDRQKEFKKMYAFINENLEVMENV